MEPLAIAASLYNIICTYFAWHLLRIDCMIFHISIYLYDFAALNFIVHVNPICPMCMAGAILSLILMCTVINSLHVSLMGYTAETVLSCSLFLCHYNTIMGIGELLRLQVTPVGDKHKLNT